MVLTSLNLAFWEISGHNTIHITDADWTPFANLFRFKGCDEEALQQHKREDIEVIEELITIIGLMHNFVSTGGEKVVPTGQYPCAPSIRNPTHCGPGSSLTSIF
jgi:hypothetical protein